MFRAYETVAFLVIGSMILVISNAYKTRFVNVIFRSGDRTPLQKELYETDPHKNYDFSPMGYGGLTNCGKLREFAFGEFLRKRYNDFLGVYNAGDVFARSTDVERTKMSLLLALAGLYPAASNATWLPTVNWQPQSMNGEVNIVPEQCSPATLRAQYSTLNWQPIPITTRPASLDVLLIPEQCPRYIEELKRVKRLPGVVRDIESFRKLMKDTARNTGNRINSTKDLSRLYDGLMAEKSMGLELPTWTEGIFPNGSLYNATVTEHSIASRSELLTKLNGGPLLKRMTDDMVDAANHLHARKATKINLFAGNGRNIAALLKTLDVYKPHVPQYSSAVIIELVNDDSNAPHVKVYNYKGIPAAIETLRIPGCQVFCPLEDFVKLMAEVMPTNADLTCNIHDEAIVAKILKDFGDLS